LLRGALEQGAVFTPKENPPEFQLRAGFSLYRRDEWCPPSNGRGTFFIVHINRNDGDLFTASPTKKVRARAVLAAVRSKDIIFLFFRTLLDVTSGQRASEKCICAASTVHFAVAQTRYSFYKLFQES
jgi:hypothetical protein